MTPLFGSKGAISCVLVFTKLLRLGSDHTCRSVIASSASVGI